MGVEAAVPHHSVALHSSNLEGEALVIEPLSPDCRYGPCTSSSGTATAGLYIWQAEVLCRLEGGCATLCSWERTRGCHMSLGPESHTPFSPRTHPHPGRPEAVPALPVPCHPSLPAPLSPALTQGVLGQDVSAVLSRQPSPSPALPRATGSLRQRVQPPLGGARPSSGAQESGQGGAVFTLLRLSLPHLCSRPGMCVSRTRQGCWRA